MSTFTPSLVDSAAGLWKSSSRRTALHMSITTYWKTIKRWKT